MNPAGRPSGQIRMARHRAPDQNMSKQSLEDLVDALGRAGMRAIVLAGEHGRALVSPELGARLLAVALPQGDCLWHEPAVTETPAGAGWNTGGQRTWVAPEHAPGSLFFEDGQWRCPPGLDPGAYQVTGAVPGREVSLRNSFTLTIGSAPVRFDIRRRIALGRHPDCFAVLVEQGVQHSGWRDGALPVGAWAILQAPAPGFAHVEFPQNPAGSVFHDDFFQPVPPDWVYRAGRHFAIYLSGSRQYKVGIPATLFTGEAVVEYFHRDPASGLWLEIRQILVHPPEGLYAEAPGGIPARDGDLLQFYNHFTADARSYAELEGHAPAVQAAGVESTLTVRYEFSWRTEEALDLRFRDRGAAGSFRFMHRVLENTACPDAQMPREKEK